MAGALGLTGRTPAQRALLHTLVLEVVARGVAEFQEISPAVADALRATRDPWAKALARSAKIDQIICSTLQRLRREQRLRTSHAPGRRATWHLP